MRHKNDFNKKILKKLNFVFIKPNQVTSLGVAIIPFLEHNDGNRALMGSSMQKQAISLINKEKPLIETGYETKIILESSSMIRLNNSSVIKYQSTNKIILVENIIKKENLKKIHVNTSLEKKKKKILIFDANLKKKKFFKIEEFRKTNQKMYITQKPRIKQMKWIKKGTMLNDNSYIENGKLCLGRNFLIAYMPFEGYNFEDAIIINKKIIEKEELTSQHIKKYLSFILNNEMGVVRKRKINVEY